MSLKKLWKVEVVGELQIEDPKFLVKVDGTKVTEVTGFEYGKIKQNTLISALKRKNKKLIIQDDWED